MAVEPAAGAPAGFTDDDYRAAGAAVTDDALDITQAMQCMQAPTATQVKRPGRRRSPGEGWQVELGAS